MNKEVLDANQILEHLTTAVVVTDFLCRITYINQAAEQILGFSKKRGIGQVLQSVIKIDDEDRSAIESCIQDSRPFTKRQACLLYTSPSPRDRQKPRMPSSA